MKSSFVGMLLIVLRVQAAAAGTSAPTVQALTSGSAVMQGCRDFINPSQKATSYQTGNQTGICVESVASVLTFGGAVNVCTPPDATVLQAMRVLVRYMER